VEKDLFFRPFHPPCPQHVRDLFLGPLVPLCRLPREGICIGPKAAATRKEGVEDRPGTIWILVDRHSPLPSKKAKTETKTTKKKKEEEEEDERKEEGNERMSCHFDVVLMVKASE